MMTFNVPNMKRIPIITTLGWCSLLPQVALAQGANAAPTAKAPAPEAPLAPPVAAPPQPSGTAPGPTSPPPPAAPPSLAPAPAVDTPAAPAPGDAPPAPAPAADAAGNLVPPKLTRDAQPSYPEAAKKEGVAASVVLEIDIDATGLVESARVVQSGVPEGYGFDEAALVAAKSLRFEPAQFDNKPVPVTISYRFRFVPNVTAPAESKPSAALAPTAKASAPPPPPPSGEMRGTLRERGTRLPLVGVKVTIFRGEGESAEGFETETDKNGEFRFEGLTPGDWRILADPAGYYPLRVTEGIADKERTTARYTIEKRSYNPYDVVVETTRVRREVSRTSIDAKQAERIPGTFGDVLAVVHNFPGVARTNGGQVVVRGSAPEDSRTFVSGIDVPTLYHFGGLRSVLPVGVLQSVDFYPGNFSVEYGRATGGIIDVGLKDLAPQKIGGYLDVSILDTSLYLEAPLGDDLSLAIAGRRSYIDTLLGATLPDGTASFVAPRYYDVQALASYHPNPAHQVETFFFLSDDRFEIVFEDPIGNEEFVASDIGYQVNFYRGLAEYSYVPNPRFSNEFKLSYGRDQTHFNVGTGFFVDVVGYQGQVRDTARYELSDAFALRGGVDYLYQDIDWTARVPSLPKEGEGDQDRPSLAEGDLLFTEMNDRLHSTAGFAELEIKPYSSLLLIPGLRVDRFSRTEQLTTSPRFTFRQDLGDQWNLKGGVGLFVQEPEFDETDKTLGNPHLSVEKAIHYSAGVEYRPLKHINLDVTGFYKTLDDLVGRSEALLERNGELAPENFANNAKGRIIGMEISARHELANRLFGWLAYTVSKAERLDSGETQHRLFDYDQTHILTMIGSYKLPRNWEIGTRFRYVTGNLYTPNTSAVLNVDADQYEGIVGRLNGARVDAFHQLDLRIDKRWIYRSWMLNAYLDIQNVYSHENPEGISYNFDFSKKETQSGLPVVPILGLRGEF